ncbi:hypothetical protein ABFA07_002851 [Porites harrisoni]
MCKKCTPSASPLVLCNLPSQITEVNCDKETAAVPGLTFDACTSAKVVANVGTTYGYGCTFKNSSDSSLFNCTTTEERVCLDAQNRLSSLPFKVTIICCQAKCCDTNNCNVQDLIDLPPTTEGLTTENRTTQGATTESPTTQGATTESRTTQGPATKSSTLESQTTESGVEQIQSSAALTVYPLIFLTLWFKLLD